MTCRRLIVNPAGPVIENGVRLLFRGVVTILLMFFTIEMNAQEVVQLPDYSPPSGQLESRDGQWEVWQQNGVTLRRRVVNLVPRSESPLMQSTRLIPEPYDMIDGNAAIYYLQAMGFLEQQPAFQWRRDFEQKNTQAAIAANQPVESVPPFVWQKTHPNDLPVEEVSNYLESMSFQVGPIAEASRRKLCSFDRNYKNIEDPISYTIPEVQAMRDLNRTQALRYLLAIGENRVEDAIAILGQQIAMGIHLGQDPIGPSCLVGIGVASNALENGYFLSEHPASPNLYWAIAALPKPLVDSNTALSYESQHLYLSLKFMRQVSNHPASQMFWEQSLKEVADVIDRVNRFSGEEPPPMLSGLGSFGVSLSIAAVVPQARQYLRNVENLSDEELDQLPNAQIYFLAIRRAFDTYRDAYSKWQPIPHWQRKKRLKEQDQMLADLLSKYPFSAFPINYFLPAYHYYMTAQTRLEQEFAMLQTVEAIRHWLAVHNNDFPESLADLDLPAPWDPVTGKPFEYFLHKQGATLIGGYASGVRFQLELRVNAEVPKND
jgi:hypothetical protein